MKIPASIINEARDTALVMAHISTGPIYIYCYGNAWGVSAWRMLSSVAKVRQVIGGVEIEGVFNDVA